MTRAVVVRYRTRPDTADDNERLIKAVFEELAAVRRNPLLHGSRGRDHLRAHGCLRL